jgi:ABC-type sugar transport system substrate-binding protein
MKTQEKLVTIALIIIIAIASGAIGYFLKPSEVVTQTTTVKFRKIPLNWALSLEENLTTPWTAKGPNGEAPSSPKDLELTDTEKEEARALNLKSYYFMGATLDVTEILNKYGTDQVLTELGKSPIPFMGCNSVNEQIDQINTLAGKASDTSFVIAEAYEANTTGPAFTALSNAGVPQVHMWTTPLGLVGTPNYIGLVDADGYGQGAAAAEMLAYAMNYSGQVGIIYFGLTQWTNVMRLAGAENMFAKYPGIQVVARASFTDPSEGYDIALGMLQSHPEIDAIWATWMVGPGTGAAEAVITLHRVGEVIVAAPDLGGVDGARHIADPNNPIIGAGEAYCIDMGRNAINAALKWLIGEQDKVKGGYFVSTVCPITRANLQDGYYKTNYVALGSLPSEVLQLLQEPSAFK